MRVRYTKTGKLAELKNGYALRLIEQGKAVAAGETGKKIAKRTAKPAADKTDGAEGPN